MKPYNKKSVVVVVLMLLCSMSTTNCTTLSANSEKVNNVALIIDYDRGTVQYDDIKEFVDVVKKLSDEIKNKITETGIDKVYSNADCGECFDVSFGGELSKAKCLAKMADKGVDLSNYISIKIIKKGEKTSLDIMLSQIKKRPHYKPFHYIYPKSLKTIKAVKGADTNGDVAGTKDGNGNGGGVGHENNISIPVYEVGEFEYITNDQKSFKKANLGIMSLAAKFYNNRITVDMMLETSCSYCNVYRNDVLIGNTGDSGLRKTFYWEKGGYRINVKKPGYKDYNERLYVNTNPTRYHRKVRLKKEKIEI